jgi:DNA-binding CsgD family transcriptional regulator/tetratricopeptide (TPR) repeat protein
MTHPVAVLPGRATEIALLERFLAEARTGGSLMLAGDPGVGLTALLEAAADSATAQGFRVVRADRGATNGLRELLRPLESDLVGLPADRALGLRAVLDAGLDPGAGLIKVGMLVLDLFRVAAAAGPVLLVVDDAHEFDQMSFDVLSFVSGRLPGTGVALLAAARRQFSPAVRRRVGGPLIPPLDPVTARQVLSRRFPTLSDLVAERMLAEAAGNPLALRELPASLTLTERAGACPLPVGPPLTDRLRDSWVPYLHGLSAATHRLLLLAALDDLRTVDRIGQVVGADEVLAGLAAAERVGVIRVGAGGVLTFSHPLLAAAVISLATREERAQAHLTWADGLKDDPERRSWHLGQALVQPDEEVADQLERTAGQAQADGDYDAAIAGLVRAGELTPDAKVRARRRAEAAYFTARTGRWIAAGDILARAEVDDPGIRASLHVAGMTSVYLIVKDSLDAAHRHLSQAVEAHPNRTDPADKPLMDALRFLFELTSLSGDQEAWRRCEEALTRLAGPVGDDIALAVAVLRRGQGKPVDLSIADRAIGALNSRSSWPEVMTIGHCALLLNRVDDCLATLRRFQPPPGAVDALGLQTILLLVHCHRARGEWAAAEQLATTRGLPRWTQPRGSALTVSPLGAIQGFLAVMRGDNVRAEQLAEQAETWAEARGITAVLWIIARTRALMAFGRGDFEEAYRQLTLINPAGTLAVHIGVPVYVSLDLIDAAVRTNRRAQALAHIELLQSEVVEVAWYQSMIRAVGEALVAETEAEAERLFESALAMTGVYRRPFFVARIQLLFGEQQRRARRPERARTLLASARDTFTWLGARPWADRAAQELRAAGRSTPPHGRADDAGLTEAERQIAELAASGLTNKGIGQKLSLSPRTVGNYLHRIYPKLAITSRAGLSDALAAAAVRSPTTDE